MNRCNIFGCNQNLHSLTNWYSGWQWAAKQGMQHNHAENSFRKHVGAMVQQGYEEVEAIQRKRRGIPTVVSL